MFARCGVLLAPVGTVVILCSAGLSLRRGAATGSGGSGPGPPHPPRIRTLRGLFSRTFLIPVTCL